MGFREFYSCGRVAWYAWVVGPRQRTVQGSIFLWVSVLVVSVLLVFSFVIYQYASGISQQRFVESLDTLSGSVTTNLNSEVAEMDRLSMTVVYSNLFQNLYAQHLEMPQVPISIGERIKKLENTEAIIEIGETILGPGPTAPQMNIFDLRGEMIGAGFYSQLIDRDPSTEAWYHKVVSSGGKKILTPPHTDSLLEQTSIVVKDKRYVSLLRTFQDPLLSTQGIIEVEQYCDTLFSELNSLEGRQRAFFLFDGSWQQLYPYDGTKLNAEKFRQLAGQRNSRQVITGVLPKTGEPAVFAVTTSTDTGWTLFIGEPEGGLIASAWQYSARIALLALAAITLSLAASLFIARGVTVPIKGLHREIERLEFTNLFEVGPQADTPAPGEIEELIAAFRKMRLKLNESLEEAVMLRAQERQAQLVALQAQLNPHFIYNMLQTINVMAETGGVHAIPPLVLNLARMLRYVSSTENTTVTLGTEVAYAQSYLESMAARFGEGLTYDIAVPDELREIVVPKLMLQPFIENCFKYVTAGKPPWEIAICGDGCRDDWSIQILDNGPGFAAQTLDRLHARLDASSPLDDQTGLSISGMGILISFRRLRLAFGESTIFTVGNRPEGGAVIRFGVGAAHG